MRSYWGVISIQKRSENLGDLLAQSWSITKFGAIGGLILARHYVLEG